MEKNKVLILIETNPKDDIFYNDWIENGYKADIIFKKINKPMRAIRRFFLKHSWKINILWLGNWIYHLNEYEAVIIHMSYLTRHLPELINNLNKAIKIKCWYWNVIDSRNKPTNRRINNTEYFSFDRSDCKKYGLKENIQYYCYPKATSLRDGVGIYYIGMKKNREEKIDKFIRTIKQLNISYDFQIITNIKEFVPYYKVKEKLMNAKSILEINNSNQSGFTLRVMESLFFETKLITDNASIINSKIYNPNNIFIIGKDDENKLTEFVNSSYDTNVNKYKKDYCLETWFNNFFI